ncbi:MAG: hypothetical protein MJB14_23765 [Spirochaetes bacterium]|nr:hypothetical protein [Spirochaetota bacterium]
MKPKNEETVVSRDIYEIAYYLTKTACQIQSVEVAEDLGKPSCTITITGEGIKKLQLDYLNSKAPVDAISYRKSLSYVRSLVFGEVNKSRKRGVS